MTLRNVACARCPVRPRVEELEGRQLLSVAVLPGPVNAGAANRGHPAMMVIVLSGADAATAGLLCAGAGGLAVTVLDASSNPVKLGAPRAVRPRDLNGDGTADLLLTFRRGALEGLAPGGYELQVSDAAGDNETARFLLFGPQTGHPSHAAGIASRSGSAGGEAPPSLPFARDHLTIQTGASDVPFSIEIARTPGQRRYGLMHREILPPEEGMLFIMPRDGRVAMWMKDTVLPLDMLFIDRHGRIVYIAREARPFSTKIISPNRPVRAVLEILGGTAALLGIGVGDQVLHPYFTPGWPS